MMDHDQLEARIAQRMIDSGWCPALTEIGVGEIEGVPPTYGDRWVRNGVTVEEACRKLGNRTWIADVVGTVPVVETRFKRMGLLSLYQEARKLIGPCTWLVEVKVTRGDFLGDRKFTAPPRAHVQFLAYPKGLVGQDEVPDGWVGMEVCGKVIRKRVAHGRVHQIPERQDALICDALAWTLWHRTWRDVETDLTARMQAERRAVEHDSRKVGKIIQAVAKYMNPKAMGRRTPYATLEEALRAHQINRMPERWLMEEVQRIVEAQQPRR